MKHLKSNYSEVQGIGPLFEKYLGKAWPQTPGPNNTTSGQQLKEKGIKKVSEHNVNWMERALRLAYIWVHLGGDFTGEDIRLHCEPTLGAPTHSNAWGALINTLIKRKIIVPTGEYRKSKHSEAHARKNAVYKAL